MAEQQPQEHGNRVVQRAANVGGSRCDTQTSSGHQSTEAVMNPEQPDATERFPNTAHDVQLLLRRLADISYGNSAPRKPSSNRVSNEDGVTDTSVSSLFSDLPILNSSVLSRTSRFFPTRRNTNQLQDRPMSSISRARKNPEPYPLPTATHIQSGILGPIRPPITHPWVPMGPIWSVHFSLQIVYGS